MGSPRVLWEDNHLLIVFKPAGLLVQGDETGDPTLLDWAADDVARRFSKPGKAFIGLPHRLDRPTSGIVVLCVEVAGSDECAFCGPRHSKNLPVLG
jgi:23S rRNA pseudouridine1911/1915/1917 synthase